MVEVKSKLKEGMINPEAFPDKFDKYLEFKTNYIRLAYPKTFISDEEKIEILSSISEFERSTEEQKLLENPAYFLTSTANFIALTEKVIKERYFDAETATQYKIEQATRL